MFLFRINKPVDSRCLYSELQLCVFMMFKITCVRVLKLQLKVCTSRNASLISHMSTFSQLNYTRILIKYINGVNEKCERVDCFYEYIYKLTIIYETNISYPCIVNRIRAKWTLDSTYTFYE